MRKKINLSKLFKGKIRKANSSKSYEDMEDEYIRSISDDEEYAKKSPKKTKKIKISKREAKKGIAVLASVAGIVYFTSKLFGGHNNQEELDTIYKLGKTNNEEVVELKNGLEIPNGSYVIQKSHGEEVNTILLTENGAKDITKYKSDLDGLEMDFYKKAHISANEADVELKSVDGTKKNSKDLPEYTELVIIPDSNTDGDYFVRDFDTGEVGLVQKEFVKIDEDLEFKVSPDQELPLYILGINGWAPLRNTEYVYEGESKNVVGHVGDPGMNFTIALEDLKHPGFYYYLGFEDKDLYLSFNDVTVLFKLTNKGLEKTRLTDIVLYEEKEEIEEGCFIFGVVSKGALVGDGFLSKGKKVEAGSLYFEFPNHTRKCVTQNGIVYVPESDKRKLEINYAQKGTVVGKGKSVKIKKPFEVDEAGEIVDLSTVLVLPEDSEVTEEGTLVHIFDERTRADGLLYTKEIPDMRKEQFEVSDDMYIVQATKDTDIRTTRQNDEKYRANVPAVLYQDQFCIAKYKDGMFYIDDPRCPELKGYLLNKDEIEIKYNFIENDLEKQKEKEEKNEEKEEKENHEEEIIGSNSNESFRNKIRIAIGDKSAPIIKKPENKEDDLML